MDLNKIPRWALIGIAALGMLVMSMVAKNVYADSQKTKTVAYQAKNSAETAQLQVAALSGQIQEIKVINEIFRKEYREDQRDVQSLLKELIRRPS